MDINQLLVFSTLVLLLLLFAWGRWRFDLVAIIGLLFLTLAGIIPGDKAFLGFGHPAVITVAAVLILGRALMKTGLIDSVVRAMASFNHKPALQFSLLVSLVTFFSAFMNNIGALALFLPVAIKVARKSNRSPSAFLMPMAFGSLLGGLITQIGTPPNIIIAMFREETELGIPFRMFDFAPVGLGVAIAGVLFIVLLGWRLIPKRKAKLTQSELFEIERYLTDLYIPPNAKYAGKRLLDLGQATEGDIVVVGHVRNRKKLPFLNPYRIFMPDDHIMVYANAEDLREFLDVTGFELTAARELKAEDLSSDEMVIIEVVVMANSKLEGQTVRSLNLRSVYGINMIGLAREGACLSARPEQIRFRVGDVLLLQGRPEVIHEVIATLGCLPLIERGLQLERPRRVVLCLGIFIVALLAAAFELVPIQIAFITASALMILGGFINLREVYESIDWPIIVLLGAMLPVSEALQTTGGSMLIGNSIYSISGHMAPWVILSLILVITMLLSNIVNNAAAALLMAPIALSIAQSLAVSVDPFLMVVAIGASSAFLTPIGHQSNTIVMGPGGYHFGDYWRMGLPLSLLIILVSVPLIIMVWPL